MHSLPEDLYELSPTQQGLLFHVLDDPQSGAYLLQSGHRIRDLDVAAFERAWQRLAERHPVLRTSFHQEGLDKPLQVVHRSVRVPFTQHDWRDLSAEEQQSRLRDYRAADRRRGLNLSEAPLLRVAVFRLSQHDYHYLWTRHHIILDGWSGPLLSRELFAFYHAFRQGRDLDLPLPRPFRDYIAWLQRQDLGKAEAFWRRYLAGFTTTTPLPIDRLSVYATLPPQRPEEQHLDVPAELTASLRELARTGRFTLSTLVQAAWALLLGRYAGQQDVVFGSGFSGRPTELPGVESMVGMFINTLPVRMRLPAEKGVLCWLRELQEQQAELTQFEYSPLVEIQRWGEIRRGVGLFEVACFFESYPKGAGPAGGAGRGAGGAVGSKKHGHSDMNQTHYPLVLLVVPGEERIRLVLNHAPRRIRQDDAVRLLQQLLEVLRSIAANPSQLVGQLSLLGEADRDLVVRGWNDTAVNYPQDKCLHELIEAQMERTPEAVAVHFEGKHLSYRELNARANQLAQYLRSLGVGADVPVAICMERSVEMVVGLLGILKAGGAYVPLDPNYPAERLAFMLQDVHPPVLLTQQALLGRVNSSNATVLCLDSDWPQVALSAACGLADSAKAHPDNLAYIIYTSGSTGKPKGAMNAHKGIVNRLLWMQDAYHLDESDRVLQKTPFSFDVSVWELFWPLISGARLVLARPGGHQDSAYLAQLIATEGITTLHFVPSMLSAFLHEHDLSGCVCLRRVICSGEALSFDLQERFFARLEAELHNLYGPTEASVDVTFHACQRGSKRRIVPIGKPIANTTLYVLDTWLQPVPVGVAGELHIGGVGVARGYLSRPGLTAEKFIPDPFAAEAGARLYKTGDLARWLPDGNLEFLGRIDHQVKVRGFRIELGEIESVLARHPAVRDSIVVARDDLVGGRGLVAYVAVALEPAPAVDELRALLRERLPDYMVPAAFVLLEALPLTPNGKVDRQALPAPAFRTGNAEQSFVAPRTPTEEVVCAVWVAVLKQPQVGRHDNFFELGGHSLLATQVVVRLRAALTVEIPLRLLFEAPTVAALAERIDGLRSEKDILRTPPLLAQARTGAVPLSFAQQRLWFLHQWEPDSPVYNVPTARRLREAVDVSALERALSEVVRRHEILRTTFAAQSDEQPVQVIYPPTEVSLPVEDLSGLSPSERQTEMRRRVGSERRRAFDLERGPLLRAVLLRLAQSDHLLLLNLHHIVTDGWSQDILFRELFALYGAFKGGQPSPLPELPLQYADYALWQRNWLGGELLQSQLDYWKGQLARLSPLEMPTDKPRPAVQRFHGAHQSFAVPAELTERLRQLSQQENATLFMTLLAGFQALLGRYSGQHDVVVGSPIAGRQHKELDNLIGFFVNTLVLRADLSGDPTFVELLRRVKETCLGAYAHQDLPFEKLVEELQPQRDPSRNPLFQVTFTLQNAAPTHKRSAGPNPTHQEESEGISKFDLTMVVNDNGKELSLNLVHNTDLFESVTIGRLARNFQTLLAAIVARPDDRLAALPCVDQDEQRQLLCEWNNTATAVVMRCVHELFLDHVVSNPTAPAVVFQDQVVSYGELNARADELAVRLRQSGASRGAVVGVCVERSVAAIVAVLAVFKVGAAYLPLDPAAPRDRLAFILQDAAVSVLLTQSHLRAALPDEVERVLLLDQEQPGPVVEPAGSWEVLPTDLAYVIYTSGSTGKPKGVLVEHRSLCNLVVFQTQTYGVGPGSCVLQFAALNFDASVAEIWRALSSGACLVVAEAQTLLPGRELIALLEQQRITHVTLPPSVLAALPDASLPALTTLIVGGEACPAEQVKRWAPGRRFFNAYGPTEATVCSSVALCLPDGTRPPIGKPIANTTLYVLDTWLQLVPVGVAGELHIGGIGLARGYLNCPELTAEKFIPDPFSTQPGARLYKSGDLVRWRADGNLEFLGRTDEQVKVRGFRIEPGEIEAVLRQYIGVRQCVVVTRQDAGSDKRLVAYLGADSTQVKTDEVRLYLKSQLPDYMVPSAFVVLAALPLTSNGKVDRNALPAPDFAPSEQAYVAPCTPIEEAIASIWCGVLRLERVGRHDGFFELGGHSLLATQVVARLRAALTVEIPLRLLFEAPTVAALAARIEELRRDRDIPRTPPLTAAPRTGAVPLSFAQQRLWFLHQWEPDSPVYNVPTFVPFSGAFHLAALQQSLDELVRRHEALRTRFPTIVGQPVQVIDPPFQVELPLTDLTRMPPGQRSSESRQLLSQEAARPFDIANGPLLRTRLIRLGPEHHRLLLAVHHIVTDGWSQEVMRRELLALYEAFRAGKPSPLPDPPLQYVDYSVWQRNWLQGEGLQRQVDYWRERLRNLPTLELPTDLPRPPVQGFRGAIHEFDVSEAVTAQLHALSRQQGGTLFMTLLAAFQTLLGRYSRQDDFAVGTPVLGRRQKELEGLIGFFVNTLVLRADLSGDPTFVELLRRVRESCLNAYDHQDLPFDKLVEELQPPRDPSRNPLFQVLFILQNVPRSSRESAPETVGARHPAASNGTEQGDRTWRRGNGTSKFDLGLQCFELPNGTLRCLLAFNTDLFVPETIARLASRYAALLAGIAADPRQRLSAFSLVDPDEGADLLRLGQTSAQQPEDPLLAQLDSLSDEELDALLKQTLAERQSQ